MSNITAYTVRRVHGDKASKVFSRTCPSDAVFDMAILEDQGIASPIVAIGEKAGRRIAELYDDDEKHLRAWEVLPWEGGPGQWFTDAASLESAFLWEKAAGDQLVQAYGPDSGEPEQEFLVISCYGTEELVVARGPENAIRKAQHGPGAGAELQEAGHTRSGWNKWVMAHYDSWWFVMLVDQPGGAK